MIITINSARDELDIQVFTEISNYTVPRMTINLTMVKTYSLHFDDSKRIDFAFEDNSYHVSLLFQTEEATNKFFDQLDKLMIYHQNR